MVRMNKFIRSFCSANTCSYAGADLRFGSVGQLYCLRHATALWFRRRSGFSVGILAEIKAKGMTVFARIDHAAGPVWRMDDDGRRISLIVTRSGRNAIGVEDDVGETQPPSVLGAVKSSGRGLAGNAQRPPSR
jgi:hypothetical protein